MAWTLLGYLCALYAHVLVAASLGDLPDTVSDTVSGTVPGTSYGCLAPIPMIRNELGYNVAQIEEKIMATNTVVRARIDGRIKQEAALVLDAMGLTVSDAFRLLLTKVAHEKSLPFEPWVPNETTIAAMRDARQGKVKAFASVEDLMADLSAKD